MNLNYHQHGLQIILIIINRLWLRQAKSWVGVKMWTTPKQVDNNHSHTVSSPRADDYTLCTTQSDLGDNHHDDDGDDPYHQNHPHGWMYGVVNCLLPCLQGTL